MPDVVKSVFITGAGSGMGREGAKLFHANGWRVGAVDRNDDGLATLSAFTLQSLLAGIGLAGVTPETVILAGGGRHNRHLVSQIKAALAPAKVLLAEDLNWRGGALEAEGFAYMAVRSLKGLPISFPGTTGVKAPLTGGRISYPKNRPQSLAS